MSRRGRTSPRSPQQPTSASRAKAPPAPVAAQPAPVAAPAESRSGVVVALGIAAAVALALMLWPRHRDDRPRAPAPAPAPAAAVEAPEDDDEPATPGEILREPREILLPAGAEPDDRCAEARGGWMFPGSTREGVEEQLVRAGFDAPLRGRLLAAARCEPGGCTVEPDDELLLALPAGPRGRMYRALGRYNGAMFSAIPFRRPLRFGPWEDLDAVPPRARDLLRRTTWRERDVEYFVDLPLACRSLDRAEVDELLRALDRRYTVDVSVRVRPGAPVEPMVRYWARALPRAAVRARFEAAAREPGGGAVPLRDLLPPMPRRRLDTFRAPSEPPYDCYWSALRFFDGDADGTEPPGPEGFAQELAARWREVPADSVRFGDMLVLYDHGTPVHAMTHVAEDLVFTKNGGHGRRPWLVMSSHDVRRDYVQSDQTRVYRLRAAR